MNVIRLWRSGLGMVGAVTLFAISSSAADQPLPAGIRIPVVLTKSVSAKLPVGAPVEGETSAQIKLPGSLGIIPKGTKVTGRVSLAMPYDKKESRLSVVLDRVEAKSGTISMRAFVVGRIKPRNSALGKGPGAIYGAQVIAPGSATAGLGTISAVEQIPIDRSCRLVQSNDPDVGSEIVSTERDVAMEIGSSFDVLTVEN